MKREKKKNLVLGILVAICAVIFATSATFLIIHLWPRENELLSYKNDVTSSATPEELPENPIDFKGLWAKNSEVVAWITIPGTVIDYPILQSSPEQKESFYLDHNFDKKPDRNGAIYIQKMNYPDFSDPNTVIYGHNMQSGRMFGQLHKFRTTSFFNEHDTIYIYTPEHILTYNLFTTFVYDNRHILNSFNFSDKDSFDSFLQQMLKPSSMVRNVRPGVNVTTDDRIITLSTCTGNDAQRLLVGGVLIDDTRTKQPD